jgi:hypothetical protein
MNSQFFFHRRAWLILAAVGLAGTGYLTAASLRAGAGFPLDDAWIHQTYARNLVIFHQWAFVPGQISGGSTAPLWSALLSIGYLFGAGPFPWSAILGFLSLAGLAWIGQAWADRLIGQPQKIPWAGLFLAGEWHLVWSAFSGMETIPYGLVILAIFYLLSVNASGWFAGILVGVAIWLRPDGITLLGPALFVAFISNPSWLSRFRQSLKILFPAVGSILIYFLFNQITAGSWLPTTFFAKQAEYSLTLTTPLFWRFSTLLGLPMIGAGVLLLPGIIMIAWQAWKNKKWVPVAALLWWLGFSLLYALRLPVTYQYGRYLVPAMPVYFLLGLAGLRACFEGISSAPREVTPIENPRLDGMREFYRVGRRVMLLSWKAAVVVTWALFAGLGGFRYASDVGIINTEMVEVARWIDANTPRDAIVAVHDIGAIGFFGNRSIIDLAGLVSPEVIPFIRDEQELAAYLNQTRVNFVVTFPTWYETLVKDKRILFQTRGTFSPESGGENMAVYAWP